MGQQSSPLKVLPVAGDAVSKGLVELPMTFLGCSMTLFATVWLLEACGEDWGCPGEPGKGVLGTGCSVPPLLPEGLGEVAALPTEGLPDGSLPIHLLSSCEGSLAPARQWGKANECIETG